MEKQDSLIAIPKILERCRKQLQSLIDRREAIEKMTNDMKSIREELAEQNNLDLHSVVMMLQEMVIDMHDDMNKIKEQMNVLELNWYTHIGHKRHKDMPNIKDL